MRDLKFRAWDHVDNVMLFADFGELQDIGMEWTAWDLPIDSPTNTGMPFEVMQFTGLKDQNGVDIYEGDIFGGFEFEVLSWDNQYQRYCIKIKNSRSGWLTEFKSKHREVIGNIYENPELLEVNNG